MGFGWLLGGYFTATLMTLNKAGNFIRLVGWAIVLFSSRRLSRYQGAFLLPLIGSALMLLLSVALAISDVTGFLYDNLVLSRPLIGEGAKVILGYGEQALFFLFQVGMLVAIRAIAVETEVKELSDNAIRNFVFLAMYALSYGVSLGLSALGGKGASVSAGVVWILYFVCIFLNLLLIHSAYRLICEEGDEEMAEKPSRFAFVNRMRQKNNEKTEKALAEYAEYRRQKSEKKIAKREERRKRK